MQLSRKGFTTELPEHTRGSFITSEHSSSLFPGALSIIYCCFSHTEYHDKLFEEHSICFPPELGRAVLKRKAEFFAGRYCAKKSLLLLDGTTADIHISPQRYPVWPSQIVGSISHSGTHAVAVTAQKTDVRAIGIDIQYEVDFKTCKAIKDQIIFGYEQEIIFTGSESTIQKLFTIAFSAKESFFKAAFAEVGWYFDFSAVAIKNIDQQNGIISMYVNETLSKNLVTGIEVQAEYKYTHDNKIITLVRLH